MSKEDDQKDEVRMEGATSIRHSLILTIWLSGVTGGF